MSGDGANISSGISTGEAQVFTPTKADYIGQIGELKYKQDQEKKSKMAGVQKQLAGLDKIDIFVKHQPLFSQKQEDIKKYAKENIDKLTKGDAAGTMEFQDLLQTYYNDANLSKTIKENYKTLGGKVAANENKYRQSTIDYLKDFEGYDASTGEFSDLDPTQFKENINYGDHVLADLTKVAKEKGAGGKQEWYTGSETGFYEKNKISPQDAYEIVYQDVSSNPDYIEQSMVEFNELPPQEKKKYKDNIDYFAQIHSKPLTFDKSSYGKSPRAGVDSYTEEDISTQPQDVNITEKVDGKDTEQNFKAYSKIQHKKPYVINASISPNWVKKSGNTKDKTGASVKFNAGETMVVATYPEGTEKAGLPIPNSELDAHLKSGVVNFQPMVTGTTFNSKSQEEISYVVPASEFENALNANGVPVGRMKEKADQLNKQYKKGKSVSKKTIKGLVGSKGYDGFTEKMIEDYYISNGYYIK